MKLSIKDSGHRSTYSDYSKKKEIKSGEKKKTWQTEGIRQKEKKEIH